MGTRNHAARLKGREIVTGALAAFALFAMFLSADTRAPIASSETRFVEYSSGGLQIVPASCESTPPYEHSTGECTTASDPYCPSGQMWNGTTCVCPAGMIKVGTQCLCPAGQVKVGTQCITPGSTPTCPSGQTWNGSACVTSTSTSCPSGYEWNGTRCAREEITCNTGYTLVGGRFDGRCEFTGCPVGWEEEIKSNGSRQCTQLQTCTATVPTCAGNYVQYRTAQCQNISTYCPFGCSGGGCLPPPESTGIIRAQPVLIRSGERTTITWETSNMHSCRVTEDNPEISEPLRTGLNGSFQTLQIRQQTHYILECREDEDSSLEFVDSATVNILPIFQEQ